MKRVYIVTLVFVFIMASMVGGSYARAEQEGFIKRMMDRFGQRKGQGASMEKPAETIPAPRPVPTPAKVEEKNQKRDIAPRVEEMEPAGPEVKLTKEEMISEIRRMLDENGEILSYIPDLKRNVDEGGNVSYTYKKRDSAGERLEDLDTSDIEGIHMKVMSESSRLNAQRIMQQMEMIRRTQRATASAPAAPPKAPPPPAAGTANSYRPPTIPQIPRAAIAPKPAPLPPSPPRMPVRPPSSPQRK